MRFQELTPATVRKVLKKFLAIIDEADASTQLAACDYLNSMFDEMVNNDFFGTEGQCDPRGDHRT